MIKRYKTCAHCKKELTTYRRAKRTRIFSPDGVNRGAWYCNECWNLVWDKVAKDVKIRL